jgi:hypothetical protein
VSDNVTVSNSPTSVNTDIPVRTIDKSGEQVQVVAIDYGGAGTEDLTVPDFATETTLNAVKNELASGLNVNNIVSADILGVAVTGRRNNEIELSFFDSFDTNLITNTTSSGGSASITGGHARYQTGSNTNGGAKGVSVYNSSYRPAHEEYAFFTAAFTAGIANSYQRIGLYDTNNGAFIGYEDTSFGVTLRSGGANTTIARASWNGDPLDGSAGSIFTRAGTPEAINLTYSNLYRIRFAWLGSASFIFEVFSPDGKWITFHTIRIPNSQLAPSIETPNLPMTLDVKKNGGGATNLSIYTACWAAGTTSDYLPITSTLTDYTLANVTRSVIAGRSASGGGTYYNVKVNPSGSLITAIGDITGVVGQATMANSLPVVIASDQSAIPVTQSGTWNINNISGTVSLPTGAAAEATLSSLNGKVTACNTGAVTISASLPAGGNNIGDVDVLTLPNVTLASQGNPFTSAVPVSDNGGSITVDGTIAATQSGTWTVTNATYSSSTLSNVTAAASNTTLLASNASRRQAILYNDADTAVYVKFGATASATSFSYKLLPAQTLELPFPVYTGIIDGIWANTPTGAMRITEVS